MKRFKKGLLTAAALLALCTGSVSAAADPEVQLDTIAEADEVWDELLEHLAEDDSRYIRFATHDYPTLDIAVTDLDANGRLEVIFRTSRMSRAMVADAEHHEKPASYISALKNIASVPLGVHATMYEVTEDGTQLARVPIEGLTEQITLNFPDLRFLKEPYEIRADGARLYHTDGVVRQNPATSEKDVSPFRLRYHTVYLHEGTLHVHLDADEEGNYVVNPDSTIDAITHTAHIDGVEMSPGEFDRSTYIADYQRDPPVRGSVNWVSGADFREEGFRSSIRTRLASSWYGFSYGIR